MTTRILAAALFAATLPAGALVAGCSKPPAQQVPVGQLLTDAELDGKYVTTTGVVRVAAGFMGSTTCTSATCKIDLYLPADQVKPDMTIKNLKIELDVGSGENEMSELPDKYKTEDLAVKGTGGKVFKHGETIKVTGKAKCKNGSEASLPCAIRVDRVDAP